MIDNAESILNITPYHAKYFAYELTKRSPSDSVQKLVTSLMDAQVDLNPHQVEAALFAFKSPLSSGAILADEVGLGKTIEAGLVISQKWAERKRRILIITPANLRKQWSQELLDKFFLPSTILEQKSFKEEIAKGNFNPFIMQSLVICSYQFVQKHSHYIKAINWDLVVIDEAHRLRNVYKPSNKIANAIKAALYDKPKLLLTATPLQNSLLELYGLVSIIDEFTFGDLDSFKTKYVRAKNEAVFGELKQRLQPICIRTLRKQVKEYVKYTKRIPILQEFYPTHEEQRLYDLVSGYLQEENLYALPASQRKLMTLILRRLLASSTFAISGTLEALATKLDDIVANSSEPISQDESNIVAENFETYDELLDEWDDDDDETESVRRYYSPEDIAAIKKETARLKEFCNLARSIKKNSKGEELLTALKRGLSEAERSGAPRKAIIFTESTRTQKYLHTLLQNTEFRDKMVLFNGTNTDPLSKRIYNEWLGKTHGTDRVTGSKAVDIRSALTDYFRDEAEIMIATEAAAEGVNLQFCSLVVNYDLPWNPQRIEQRIGRCHRYGQKYDVVVVNFLNKSNAADVRVYELLAEKFQLFNGVFGASDEVLGIVENGVDFEKRIMEIYQLCRTEKEIQESFDALQMELETQITETLLSTRQKLFENFDPEVVEKLKVREVESKQFLTLYQEWLLHITKYYLKGYAEFDTANGSFILKRNPFPDENIHQGPYFIGKVQDDANLYRIGHPLAKRIIEACKSFKAEAVEIVFDYAKSPYDRIAIIEEFTGSSGWLVLYSITLCSLECEDVLVFSGITDTGQKLDHDQCRRLFALEGTVNQIISGRTHYPTILRDTIEETANQLLKKLGAKNKKYFIEETERINKWAEDIISDAENDIKTTKGRIRELNRQLRSIEVQEEILKINREIQELENRKRKQRQKVFEIEDEIERKRDEIINDIEEKMQLRIEKEELFRIRWSLK